jgi:hypothetical protein
MKLRSWGSMRGRPGGRHAMPQPSESFTLPTGNVAGWTSTSPSCHRCHHRRKHTQKKTVRRAEASIRPVEYGQLMAQRQHLEKEVSTRGQRGEERRDRERVAHGR